MNPSLSAFGGGSEHHAVAEETTITVDSTTMVGETPKLYTIRYLF
jgi:hypothetical protein